jgi:hypothetical protein
MVREIDTWEKTLFVLYNIHIREYNTNPICINVVRRLTILCRYSNQYVVVSRRPIYSNDESNVTVVSAR